MKKNIVYPITVSSIMVAMIVTFSTMSIVGLHSLFLQNAIAQQQPTAGANIQTMRFMNARKVIFVSAKPALISVV
jgi:hypothetical protein